MRRPWCETSFGGAIFYCKTKAEVSCKWVSSNEAVRYPQLAISAQKGKSHTLGRSGVVRGSFNPTQLTLTDASGNSRVAKLLVLLETGKFAMADQSRDTIHEWKEFGVDLEKSHE